MIIDKEKNWYEETKNKFVERIHDIYTLNLAISVLEDRKELLDENLKIQKALIDIREYLNKDAILGELSNGNNYYLKDDEIGKDILQIIDKVLGGSDE